MLRALVLACPLVVPAASACSSSSGHRPPDAGLERDAPSLDSGDPSGLPTGGLLNVLSLNLHCLKTEGTAFATNAARFAAIAAAVAAQDIDVVLAQEVCVGATENARELLVAALASTTGTTWSSTVAFTHRAWEGTPDAADEHVAIVARGALSAPRATVHRTQGSLRRVTLGATMVSRLTTASGAGVPVRVYTVHLDHEAAAVRADQGREVAAAAMVDADDEQVAIAAGTGVALPVVVAGDFNSRAAEPPPQALVEFGFVETSGSAATTRIDHVFSHRSAPIAAASTMELFVGADAVSDHPGVLVRFVAAAPSAVRLTRIVASGTFPLPLSLRGDRAPLSWTRGWPAIPRAGAASVAVVTSELPAAPFAYKFLRQDADWALGDNATGAGEATNISTPAFP